MMSRTVNARSGTAVPPYGRSTANTCGFAPGARIVHIDMDSAEIGKNVPVTVGIVGDARDVTHRLAAQVQPRTCDLFFFSSRRRHTRCLSDWSSDVCSSD